MAIEWSPETREFHLRNEHVSYVGARPGERLARPSLFRAVARARKVVRATWSRASSTASRTGSANPCRSSIRAGDAGDYRIPALSIELPNGSGVLDLRYSGHRTLPGKPAIPGLPSTYVEVGGEAETLEVTLTDAVAQLEVRLLYTIFRDRPVVIRSARILNTGSAPVIVRGAMSASLDLPDAGWELITLSGDWARERHVERQNLRARPPFRLEPARRLERAAQPVRGPCAACHDRGRPAKRSASAWSTRATFWPRPRSNRSGRPGFGPGSTPRASSWLLEPGAEFATPEAVLAFSAAGLDPLSEAYHGLYRDRMARGSWRDKPRPIVINNWEATYFDFDEAKLLSIATAAKKMGIEMFVLDDGWFGRRDDDTTSLGDWKVNATKLPGGLESVARKVEALGMRFGLWIEPEMISRHSDLFAEHADWTIGIPSRPKTESRNQYVLDMSRPEVVDYLFDVLSGDSRQRPDLLREVGHEPEHHRALQRRAAGLAAGRVLPPLHPRASIRCTSA